jgi:hypothetical protein
LTAEELRKELRDFMAEGMSWREAVAARKIELAESTKSFVDEGWKILTMPETTQRMLLGNFDREIERHVMLYGEMPSAQVLAAHEEIRSSLIENITSNGVRIRNPQLIANCASETLGRARIAQLRAVEERLNARADVNDSEKQQIAKHLALPPSARIFGAFLRDPDRVIAAGMIGSGARDMEQASDGLSPDQRKGLGVFLEQEASRRLSAQNEKGEQSGPPGPSLEL